MIFPRIEKRIYRNLQHLSQFTLRTTKRALESYRTTSDWNKIGLFLPISANSIEDNTIGK